MSADARRQPPPVPPEALRRRVSASEAPSLDAHVEALPPPVPPEALARAHRRAAPPPVPAAAHARRRTLTVATTPATEEHGDLVEAARAGSVRAFNTLVLRFRPRILALALHLTGSATDADDIAQDVFLKAYEHLPHFEGRSAFFTWLYRIAVNRSLQVIQKRRVRTGPDLDDPRVSLAVAVDAGGAPQRALELRETYAQLVAAFDRLSPLLRTTVVLTTLQGLTHPEAAAVLNTTEGTIAWRMHEARDQLRRALDEAARRPAEAPPVTQIARRSARRTTAPARDPDAASCALALALTSVVYA